MTAETLKPFIAPTSSKNYVTTESSATPSRRHRGSCYFLAITASVITIILTAALLGITIWNTMRISNLQTEVQSLNRVIDSMQKRLGLTYLDDLSDFEKEEENNNALIDDVLPDADGDDDDEDDDDNDPENMSGDDDDLEDEEEEGDYYDYEELMNKFKHYQETEDEEEDSADSIGDDNLYDDFEKFNGSKKKHQGERKTRSVSALSGDNENSEEKSQQERTTILRSLKDGHVKSIVANDNFERRRSPLRGNHSRRRKFPLVKSGDSLISAKSLAPLTSDSNEVKPAAHFHLSHKVAHHQHRIRIRDHDGDVYIGHPSLSNEMNVDNYFHVEHGVVTVREPGLYYVYAQICYNSSFAQNGFAIFHGDKSFLQCVVHNINHGETLINTCHTSGLIYLHRNEHIHIRDFHKERVTYLREKSDRSYFGLIKI